jgi:hypothetical protein
MDIDQLDYITTGRLTNFKKAVRWIVDDYFQTVGTARSSLNIYRLEEAVRKFCDPYSDQKFFDELYVEAERRIRNASTTSHYRRIAHWNDPVISDARFRQVKQYAQHWIRGVLSKHHPELAPRVIPDVLMKEIMDVCHEYKAMHHDYDLEGHEELPLFFQRATGAIRFVRVLEYTRKYEFMVVTQEQMIYRGNTYIARETSGETVIPKVKSWEIDRSRETA